ncbi:hypothetical protein [Rhizobium halophytocola]|uniref:Uncharacterized protein n=1 Tax=Rhizobium halophytocola TaxID=735519 RepID=A0ABS4DYR8_9HYPH|nr:hypothetical protein [Rhizobium halophytocola]MBP1850826.1 hypothetical protein [Rhizobium halophytocola]
MEKQVVEYAGVPVGITVPEGDSLKFIAVKFPVIELDGSVFRNLEELRRAIHRHLQSGKTLAHGFEIGAPVSTEVPGKALNVA